LVPLPFRFLALKFVNSITGYDEQRKTGIFSNEVFDPRYEHFRVSGRDGSVIATGLYADIKEDLKRLGGKFTRSIYAITPKGAIVNIRLKGGQIVNFGTIEKFGNRWRDEWIQVTNFDIKSWKDGDQDKEYTVPIFSFAGTLTDADEKRADDAYKLIKDYFDSKPAAVSRNSYTPQPTPAATPAPATAMPAAATSSIPFSAGANDDLPF